MLKALGSRLTYANVVATGALFVALGGGAYALSGIPDRSGVYHGCVDGKTSVLRVVKAASSCRKAKTVRHGRRRVRIPGESAIAWSQTGPRGFKGDPGLQGATGTPGTPGTARAFAHVLHNGTLDVANSSNGIDVRPLCSFPCGSVPPQGPSGWQCFKLGFTPKSAIATTELGEAKSAARVQIPGTPVNGADGCPPGYLDSESFTFDTTTGAVAAAGFYIVFN